MTEIITTTTKRRTSIKYGAGLAISALLDVGAFASPANAEWDGYNRGREHNWNGGYYNAPPVVYGSPYGSSYYGNSPYYAPPVVYGPGVGISLPFVNLNIR
jgi:hypothetical protein